MNPKLHDFRKPPPLAANLELRLENWARSASRLASQRSGRHLPFPVECALSAAEMLPPEEALARLPEAAVGYRVALGEPEVGSLLSFPRPVMLALVSAALGDVGAAVPEDRELTTIEESLCEYLMQQLFATALQDAWPGTGNLAAVVRRREYAPRWGRVFATAEHVVCCTFLLRAPVGEHPWYWLAPMQGPLEQLGRPAAGNAGAATAAGPLLDALVRELPVELVVTLGHTELSLSQLSGLQPGDMLILNQRVGDPLPASIDGQRKFQAWPGRVGLRQAVQVESLIG
jgi:flagellar motor switch protein FliM